jgi:glycosyltransferase involved in cell wall biosynthesis
MSTQAAIPGLVSINMPFFNTRATFLKDAIQSVQKQTYDRWELILVDDGSRSAISAVARDVAESFPGKVRCLEHEGHRNLGISASRNLGLSVSSGEFIAFLDSDDVWDETQLEEQVALMQQYPDAGMVFGNTLYWASWPGSDQASTRDRTYDLILRTPQLVKPPNMLKFYLQGKAITPCMTSVMIRSNVLSPDTLFEEEFTGHYEDQVFLAKVWANYPVYVVGRTWGKYRQHSESVTADGDETEDANAWRARYLRWLEGYLATINLRGTAVWRALRVQLWMSRFGPFGRVVRAWREKRRLWNQRCRHLISRLNQAKQVYER